MGIAALSIAIGEIAHGFDRFNIGNFPQEHVRRLVLWTAFAANVVQVLVGAVLVYRCCNCVAARKGVPFLKSFVALTVGLTIGVLSLSLRLLDSCVTGKANTWMWASGTESTCGLGAYFALPTAASSLASAVLLLCSGRAHCLARARLARGDGSVVLGTPTTDPEAIPVGAASRMDPDRESPRSAEPSAKTQTGTKVGARALTLRPRSSGGCGGRSLLVVTACGLCAYAASFALLAHFVLRPPCGCTDSDGGPSYSTSRWCVMPADAASLPPPAAGSQHLSYVKESSCAALVAYIRAGSCPDSTRTQLGYVDPRRGFGDGLMPTVRVNDRVAGTARAMPEIGIAMAAEAAPASGSSGASAAPTAAKATPPSFSGTNVQVQGVDEADLVKTDGSYIYTLGARRPWSSSATLSIVRSWPAESAALVSQLELSTAYGVEPREMLLHDDTLLVIGVAYRDRHPTEPPRAEPMLGSRVGAAYYIGFSTVKLLRFDVSDRAAPRLTRLDELEGSYISARKVGANVHVVTTATPRRAALDAPTEASTLPVSRSVRAPSLAAARALDADGFTPVGACRSVGYVQGVLSNSFVSVSSLSMLPAGADAALSTEVAAARGANVFASKHNLYIASTLWNTALAANATGASRQRTVVLRFELRGASTAFRGLAHVPGFILNQWAMDEFDESPPAAAPRTFRIVTTADRDAGISRPSRDERERARTSNLYTLDVPPPAPPSAPPSPLAPLGSLEGLAPGERVYAVRFMGTRAYVVTFRQVDPLFVIELADRRNPSVLGELKVPGYSDYLHPLNSTHLIGIGKDATLEGVATGLKLALFDASDPSRPAESYSLTLGRRGTDTSALYDHRAFAFDSPRRLLTLPTRLSEAATCTGQASRWSTQLWQGALVWHVGESGFGLRGVVSHYDPASVASRDDFEGTCRNTWAMPYCTASAATEVSRAIYMGDDVLYTISAAKVRADSLGRLRNLTADAAAAGAPSASNLDAVTTLWADALSGSAIRNVDLGNQLCSDDPSVASGGYVPEASSGPALPACPCTCTSYCALKGGGGVAPAIVALAAQGLRSDVEY